MMMKSIILKGLLTMTALVMSGAIAFAALTVDAAKQQGLVGERPDGMLGIVASGNPEVSTLVDTTNAERLAKYQAIAAKNGTELEQVKTLAGKKLIESAGSGEYIMTAGGGWQKK